MRHALLAGLSLLAMTPAFAQAPSGVAPADETALAARSAARIAYPATATVDVKETLHGQTVADPYRWLENDVRTDPKVAAWVGTQNAVTNAYLASLPGRAVLKERMKQLTDFERFGVPRKAGERIFYSRNDGLQNQSVLWVRDAAAPTGRVLIDPNLWAKDGATALAEWVASEDGSKLVYGVQDGGTDWRTVKVLDVATGKDTGDEIKWVKFSNLAWAKDGSGFFYSRFAEPAAGQTFQSTNTDQKVYFHRLGTPQDDDLLVYATPDRPQLGHNAQVTDDGRWLLITSSAGTDERYELHVLDLAAAAKFHSTGGTPPRPMTLVKGLEHNYELVGSEGSKFWFVTNKGAPRGKIVALDALRRIAPVDILAERKETLVGASLVGAKIVLAYLGDAKSDAEMINLDGSPAGDIKLPGIGTAAGFSGKAGDSETFYAFSSFATPATIYKFDTATGKAEIFAQPKVAFDPNGFTTEQRFFASKDGTKVPVFIVRKKGAAGPAPTLLYGYGGFNISVTPSFSATRLAWVEQGGVLAIANLRGGGEYGKAWHDAGRLANKQNVFDDFIAAGEYLIREGVATKDGLVVQGGSNGGLLVGAVVNQRPNLFAAALPAVGVMDMLRFDRWTAGRYWVDDYGYPSKAADFKVLRGYSPYHNIGEGRAKGGKDYPAILVTTADTDDRVVPGHSFKYAAALQATDLGDKPRLIRIETRAGHGSGKPTDKIIEEAADVFAFAAAHTGLVIK